MQGQDFLVVERVEASFRAITDVYSSLLWSTICLLILKFSVGFVHIILSGWFIDVLIGLFVTSLSFD